MYNELQYTKVLVTNQKRETKNQHLYSAIFQAHIKLKLNKISTQACN